jgi:hypothetical protein
MRSSFAYLLVLRGLTYPLVAFLILLGIVLYQLISGNLLNLSWKVWATRRERPGTFWTVLGIEAGVTLIGLYVSTL